LRWFNRDMHWLDHGNEHRLVNERGETMARVYRAGCCWYAVLGYSNTSGRFKRVSEAKMVAEHMLHRGDKRELARGN